MNSWEDQMLDAGALRKKLGPITDSLDEFVDSVSRFPKLVRSIEELNDQNLALARLTRWHTLAHWADQGFNVFDLTHSLTAGMLLTQTEGNWNSEAKLPFATTLLRIQDGFLSTTAEGTRYWINYIWVHKFISTSTDDGPGEGCITWVLGSRNAQTLLAGQCRLSELNDLLSRGEDFATEVEDPTVNLVMGDQDHETVKSAMRLVSNFCCWLSAQPPGAVRSDASSKKQRTGNESWPTTWFVGRDVKLPSGFIKAAQDVSTGNTSKGVPGWRLRLQHIVRGHWRNQACGPNYEERKRIWIEPFWKGPEGEAAWVHLYKASGGILN